MCFGPESRPPLPPIRGSALDARDLTLASRDGTPVAAYLARAEAPSGAGVVILPDVRGLTRYYEELALRFAEAGADAVAVDLYARSAGASKRDEGWEYEPHVSRLDLEGLTADVAAAADLLRERAEVERIYTIGFCIGGRISLLQAAGETPLEGVIGLYPWPTGQHRSGLPAPSDEATRFSCPVLTLYGGADAAIPPEARQAFDDALDAAGVEHRSVVYPEAPHSFFDRKAADHAEDSAAAWREILAFMRVGASET